MNRSISKQLGELFAHFQNLTDTFVQALIKRIEENSGGKNTFLKSISSFGNAYWKKYNEIKKSEKTDQ
ncbi:MAG: hypothetical protein V3S48_06285 [Candidatus Neomarinimicrobiota bacterium]